TLLSVQRAGRPGRLQRLRIPEELVEEAIAGAGDAFVARAILAERLADARDRQQARHARHAHFGQAHAQLHRRADAAEGAGRVADDAGRPPEILLEEMIEQVLQRRRDAVIIFAADHEEA